MEEVCGWFIAEDLAYVLFSTHSMAKREFFFPNLFLWGKGKDG